MNLIIIIILFIIFFYCCFVVMFRLKLNKLENKIQKYFKIRNNKVVSLFYASKHFLNKHDEIFNEYINLKRKDFSETILNYYFENRLNNYKRLHNEINFLFKICEVNGKLTTTGKYNYIKEEILKESLTVGKSYDLYKKMISKYRFHHKISKIFIIGLFLR